MCLKFWCENIFEIKYCKLNKAIFNLMIIIDIFDIATNIYLPIQLGKLDKVCFSFDVKTHP